MADRRCLRLAHRGDWRLAPENTIAAFQAAVALPGCDGIELDVRVARDGTPVVIHDETLDRVQGRPGRVDGSSVDDLEDLGVATLADALAAIPHGAFVDVELKAPVAAAAVAVLAAARGPELRRAVVSSFDPVILAGIARRAPGWPLWLNVDTLDDETVAVATGLGCSGVAVEWHAIDRAALARASAAGLEVAAWTVRRRATFDRLAAMGVVAVCVEGPALGGGQEVAA